MENPDQEYVAALRCTATGVITWSVYPSEAVFNDWFEKHGNLKTEVVEKGITEERAIALSRSTPRSAHISNAIDASIDPATGVVIPEILLHQLAMIRAIDHFRTTNEPPVSFAPPVTQP